MASVGRTCHSAQHVEAPEWHETACFLTEGHCARSRVLARLLIGLLSPGDSDQHLCHSSLGFHPKSSWKTAVHWKTTAPRFQLDGSVVAPEAQHQTHGGVAANRPMPCRTDASRLAPVDLVCLAESLSVGLALPPARSAGTPGEPCQSGSA